MKLPMLVHCTVLYISYFRGCLRTEPLSEPTFYLQATTRIMIGIYTQLSGVCGGEVANVASCNVKSDWRLERFLRRELRVRVCGSLTKSTDRGP